LDLLLTLGIHIHSQQAVSKIYKSLGFVGEELWSEAVKAVAALEDDAEVAQEDRVLGGGVGGSAGAFGKLGDHELIARRQFPANAPADGIANDDAEDVGERERERRWGRGSLGV